MSFSFLLCSERSGSNLLSSIINNHSQICSPAVKHIISPFARNLFRYEPLDDHANWARLLHHLDELINVDFSQWRANIDFALLSSLAKTGDTTTLIRNLFLEEMRANGKQHCFIKELLPHEYVAFLFTRFPNAKYVHQVRDPRDMALSWMRNPHHKGGIVRAAYRWRNDQRGFAQIHHEKKINQLSHQVRYEDLLSNTEQTIQDITQFLGFDFELQALDYHLNAEVIQRSQKQPAWQNLSKGILPDNQQKYLKELTEEDIAIIESICFYEMRALGYDTHIQSPCIDESTIRTKGMQEDSIYEHKSNGIAAQNWSKKSVFYQQPPLEDS